MLNDNEVDAWQEDREEETGLEVWGRPCTANRTCAPSPLSFWGEHQRAPQSGVELEICHSRYIYIGIYIYIYRRVVTFLWACAWRRAGRPRRMPQQRTTRCRAKARLVYTRISSKVHDIRSGRVSDVDTLKGSVERSSLPWAIFLIFTRNRPWKSEDHLCTLFFIEMSKESLEKSERTPPVSWRPWALAYSRDQPYNFSCLSAVSKNRRFRSIFSALGCHLARKSLSWPAMSVSNKKQEFEQRKRIKLFDDFWVRAYRFDFAPRRRPRARSI